MQILAGHPFIQPNLPLAVSQTSIHPSTRQFKNEAGQPTQESLGAIKSQPAARPVDTHAVTMGALTILVPLGFLISILVHRRLKTMALRRQIAALEKLWSLNCHEEIQ